MFVGFGFGIKFCSQHTPLVYFTWLACFFQFVNYLLGFFFQWMCDGFGRADIFAASAEYNAFVWDDYSSFLTASFLGLEGANMAEVNTFSTGYTFFVVYLWVPRDFFPRNSLVGFFGHVSRLLI